MNAHRDAALATLTHLRALARYVNVPEVTVQERLQDTLTQWRTISGLPPDFFLS